MRISKRCFYCYNWGKWCRKKYFVECLIGLQKFDKGKFYLNKKITTKPLISKINIVGYVPQEVVLIEGSLLENIIFFRNYDESLLNTLLNSKLASWIYDLPNGLYTQLGNKGMSLSGGQKQRLGILRALFKFPQILIIDETFSGLDKQSISNVLSSLEEFKSDLIILIISHQLEVIKKCDKIIEISDKNSCRKILSDRLRISLGYIKEVLYKILELNFFYKLCIY